MDEHVGSLFQVPMVLISAPDLPARHGQRERE
jgi:hypothetical protein